MFMQREFVIVECDVHCKWTGPHPRYRCYVNDELFTERTWIWDSVYLEEMLQIQAPPGKYQVKFELVDPKHASLTVKNVRIKTGPAVITPKGEVQIYVPERPQ